MYDLKDLQKWHLFCTKCQCVLILKFIALSLLQVLLHQRAYYRQGNFRHVKVFYMCRPGDECYISKDMILPSLAAKLISVSKSMDTGVT